MADGSHFVKKKKKKKSFISIWNGQIWDRKWISDIQNGRRKPFCKKKIKLAYRSEMARNALESELKK